MYRALLVCNSVYPLEPDQLPRLLGPVRDGLTMWSALTDTETGLFRPEDVEVLFECDKDEILKTANRFFQHCEPNDVLLFYYSGHGRKGKANLHLCARDTTIRVLPASSVSGNELKEYMETSPAQSIIVILDCCHSGAFKGDPPKISPGPLAGKGRFVVTASSAAQRAADASAKGQPSPFTRALVEGLRHAEPRSAEEGALVAVDDVYKYALRALPEGVPQPQRRVNGAGDAVIAKRRDSMAEDMESNAPPTRQGKHTNEREAPTPPEGAVSQWLQGLGFAGRRVTEPSLGDRLSWRMFLLASALVGLFSYLAWRAWLSDVSDGYDTWSDEKELFFQCCGLLAALSALVCVASPLVPSRLGRGTRTARFGIGLAFGVLWLYSVTSLGLNFAEQALLQSSIGFYFIAAVLEKLHDSLFLAGALVSFAGVLAPAENLGYGSFDVIVFFQVTISAATMACWYFGATERQFITVAAVNALPGAVSFVVHGIVPGLSWYGTGLALLSAALGDGTRPSEGSPSALRRALRKTEEAVARRMGAAPVRPRR